MERTVLPVLIRTADDFERVVKFKVTPESVGLEFKATYDKADASEIRKDVLALANSWGGTILVGVSESRENGNEAVASGLAPKTDLEEIKKRITDVLAKKVFPSVRAETFMLSVPTPDKRARGEILAVCVWPLADGLASYEVENDPASLRFPYRFNDRVKFFGPAEVTKRMDSQGRRMQIRARELGFEQGAEVRIASAVTARRLERDFERRVRLQAQGMAETFTGNRPPHLQSILIEEPVLPHNAAVAELSSTPFLEQFSLRIAIKDRLFVIDVPFGAVRELWRTGSKIGLALACEIVVQEGEVLDSVLRYPTR